MKQVRQRTALIILLIALLAAGMALFCIFYFVHGADWASFSANAHAYTDGTLTSGEILDREGVTLYDPATGEYADSRSLRRATLHAVGDPQNNISTGAKTAFRSRLVGFNPLTGTTTGGHKLYLSIDSSLNETARDLLNGRKGSVAVYNYQTGQILCMVSSPDFDPSDPPTITDGDSRYDGVYMNRVLSSTFTPGSVFKVVTTAAAIEQLPDIFERSFTCTGSVKIGGDTITCPHAHGTMDFYSAFANSCNCVYAQLAVELGGETLERYARSAGLLESHDVSGIPTAAGSFDVGADDSNVGWSGARGHTVPRTGSESR